MSANPSHTLPVVIVAAVARNGVIGRGNMLLWRLSSDMKRFRDVTMGKPMIMGRKTYDSIGRPLPGRETIVVTRDPAFRPAGVHTAASLDEALAIARARALAMGAGEIIIAGGGEIYAQAMAVADRLVITHAELDPPGDTLFPAIEPGLWRQVSIEKPPQGEKDEAAFSFAIYERR